MDPEHTSARLVLVEIADCFLLGLDLFRRGALFFRRGVDAVLVGVVVSSFGGERER